MRIIKLKLYTNKIELEKRFYSKILGLKLLEENTGFFSVNVGWTELSFEKSENKHNYHYCFLIPANKLQQALKWIEKRTEVLVMEDGRKIESYKNWNADSFYFYDASGNIAEFIVRYDLNHSAGFEFDISDVLGVNEIGLGTKDVQKINHQLESGLGTKFWKGDLKRFGTNGSPEGLILLANYNLKEVWFPTSIKIKPEPFEATIENEGNLFRLEYRNEALTIKPIN